MKRIPAVFVSPAIVLSAGAKALGGVQIATREYIDVLTAAGFDLKLVPMTPGAPLLDRIMRRFVYDPYPETWPADQTASISSHLQEAEARHVFLNLVDVAPLARHLRERDPSLEIILLSHGTHSADELHAVRYRGEDRLRPTLRSRSRLGAQLIAENEQRQHIDHVFCLSAIDRELELWTGAKDATWLPRILGTRPPLDWQPVPARLGYVGTLDHPPNVGGLVDLLEALAKRSPRIEVRVVGGPADAGLRMASKYPFVRYLGALDDEGLRAEAGTWSCALHPLFCYARGCSTKLAVLLDWHLPIVTTREGRRGYAWREGTLLELQTPEAMADFLQQDNSPGTFERMRDKVTRIVASGPGEAELVSMVRTALRLG